MTTIISERAGDLLLKKSLSDDDVQRFLAAVSFADWQTAYRRLQQIAINDEAQQALANSLPHLLTALSDAANPDHVLVNLSRFAHSVASQVDLFDQFARNPRTLDILITLFAGSQFLTEILLRSPEYFDRFSDHHRLTRTKSAQQYDQRTRAAIIPLVRLSSQDPADPSDLLNALRRFQRYNGSQW